MIVGKGLLYHTCLYVGGGGGRVPVGGRGGKGLLRPGQHLVGGRQLWRRAPVGVEQSLTVPLPGSDSSAVWRWPVTTWRLGLRSR